VNSANDIVCPFFFFGAIFAASTNDGNNWSLSLGFFAVVVAATDSCRPGNEGKPSFSSSLSAQDLAFGF
jgi:hypothetical protein